MSSATDSLHAPCPRVDCTGEHFGSWTVIEDNGYFCLCECACDKKNRSRIRRTDLEREKSVRCKECSSRLRHDRSLIQRPDGKLTVSQAAAFLFPNKKRKAAMKGVRELAKAKILHGERLAVTIGGTALHYAKDDVQKVKWCFDTTDQLAQAKDGCVKPSGDGHRWILEIKPDQPPSPVDLGTDNGPLYSTRGAAKKLDCSEVPVCHLIRSGKLAAKKIRCRGGHGEGFKFVVMGTAIDQYKADHRPKSYDRTKEASTTDLYDIVLGEAAKTVFGDDAKNTALRRKALVLRRELCQCAKHWAAIDLLGSRTITTSVKMSGLKDQKRPRVLYDVKRFKELWEAPLEDAKAKARELVEKQGMAPKDLATALGRAPWGLTRIRLHRVLRMAGIKLVGKCWNSPRHLSDHEQKAIARAKTQVRANVRKEGSKLPA